MPARLHVMVSELPDPASRPATNAEPTSVAPPRAETTSSEESNALQYMRLERDAALEELAFLREQLRSTEAYYAHRLEVMFAGLYHAPALALLRRNRLLGALSRAELTALLPHLELVRLEHQDTFFEPAGPIDYVLFPETAVVSFVSTFEDGGTVEVGTAGCEGMVGLPVFLGEPTSTVRWFTQIPGTASRMDATTFARLAATPGTLHRLMLRYTQALLAQVSQTAACNATHLVEQRCARWLLMTHDRVEGDEFPLTHEFLAFMLNVRRAGVTLAMRALQDAGVVHSTRGHVKVADRAGLERASCECYRVVSAHFARLLEPNAPSRA